MVLVSGNSSCHVGAGNTAVDYPVPPLEAERQSLRVYLLRAQLPRGQSLQTVSPGKGYKQQATETSAHPFSTMCQLPTSFENWDRTPQHPPMETNPARPQSFPSTAPCFQTETPALRTHDCHPAPGAIGFVRSSRVIQLSALAIEL
jgi:hypothetical protein